MTFRILWVASTLTLSLLVPCEAAWRFFNPKVEADIPTRLSQSGLYSNWNAKTVTPEAQFYEVNSPLWSDGAHKSRWFILPPNTRIVFNDTSDYWDYPNGATFIKLFKHELIPGDSSSSIFWETRVLVNQEDSSNGQDYWYGFTYKWVPDGSSFTLIGNDVADSVFNVALEFWPQGRQAPSSLKKWHFPSRDECVQCHRIYYVDGLHGRSILGFFSAQINRPSRANASLNQISEFFAKGFFQWENKGTSQPTPVEVAAMPRWHPITDSTQDLNQRARAYLAANCSGCHGNRGLNQQATAGARPNYDFYTGKAHMRLSALELSSDYGIDSSRLVYPGKPEKSIVLFRQTVRSSYAQDVITWLEDSSSTRPAKPELNFFPKNSQMPKLATFEVDSVATRILRQWILAFDTMVDFQAPPLSVKPRRRDAPNQRPLLASDFITVPEGTLGLVSVCDLQGRQYPLQRIVGNRYALPSALRRGVYVLRVGSRIMKVYRP